MSDEQVLAEQISIHEERFDHELSNWKRAVEVGSLNSADRILAVAAHHAAILTALRARSGD